ncbi:MAG: hypothetical protein BWY78_01336 [Alphaproteobacteria bacterium ADurb.Bin438]|nr:MAG: hypothetical protein BWY78_01336 [Alphaproteobacteria bacterium ADurb.Bin438]
MSKIILSKEDAEKIYRQIDKKTFKKVAKITITEKKPTIFESKFGGIPYIPNNAEIPKDKNGKDMHFLAQIECEKLKELNDFPNTGLLQFFVCADDTYGLNFKDYMNSNFKILYHKEIDKKVSLDDILNKIKPLDKDFYQIIDGEYKIEFSFENEPMSYSDFRFNKIFVETYNSLFPNNPITKLFDVDDEILEDFMNERHGCGHKISGYPSFVQGDPRYENKNYEKFDTLLFQIDSELKNKKWLAIWGDAGVGNFFINKENLKNCDFNEILYYWDCG